MVKRYTASEIGEESAGRPGDWIVVLSHECTALEARIAALEKENAELREYKFMYESVSK
jgi:hypothetical protein